MKLSSQQFVRVLAASIASFAAAPALSQTPAEVTPPDAPGVETIGSAGCAEAIRDSADPGTCIEASSVPQLGKLLPLSDRLFVSPATGFVGVGTTFPTRPLEVVGSLAVSNPASVLKSVMRSSGNGSFGIVETISSAGGGFPTVTNLVTTSSIDPEAGALATVRGPEFLTALTTPANDSSSGFVSVRNANVEVAGINGGTGIVFGAAKTFVQPHPADPTQEIAYVSLEGPEHGVYFRGTAQLVNGEASLSLPESFRLVARAEGVTVNLTPLGPNRGLYVARKGPAGIVVRENEGGAGDVSFDFLVMGVRAALPDHVAIRENTHFAPEPGSVVPAGSLPGSYRALMIQNGTLDATGAVSEASATRLGWRQEQGAWTGGRRASAPLARD